MILHVSQSGFAGLLEADFVDRPATLPKLSLPEQTSLAVSETVVPVIHMKV